MMDYLYYFNLLKQIETYDADEIEIDEQMVLRNFDFTSKAYQILPQGEKNQSNYSFWDVLNDDNKTDTTKELIDKSDAQIDENIHFRYHALLPKKNLKAQGVILMFHGFNEKHWHKYLPWGYYLAQQTGKAVLFFPIAFHMNRAPALWSNARRMYSISEQRKMSHPDIMHSTLSNVAISTRLHNKPQRFIWSGLQSYYDVIALVEQIKSGAHSAIASNATIDLMSYSIGSFLSEIVMMTNPNGYFSKSRFVSFCGGAVFNRLSPVSKFILDSEANVSLYSFLVEHLESHMRRDKVLEHYLQNTDEGRNFQMMLNYKHNMERRESTFRSMADRVYAIALQQDTIIPPYEVINALQGQKRDIPIKVDIMDYPYAYKHEDPFPATESDQEIISDQFNKTFIRIAEFLNY